MFRGMTTFVCDNCGYKFKGMNLEWNATALSQPLKCPKCGSYHTSPSSLFGFNRSVYKKIWEQMDDNHKNS